MRPPVPDVVPQRSQKSSFEPQWTDPRNTPANFFLTRSSHDNDSEDESSHDASEVSRDSMYGVQSLDETVHQASAAASKCQSNIPSNKQSSASPISNTKHTQDDLNDTDSDVIPPLRRRSTLKPFDLLNPKPDAASLQPPSEPALSRPLTPLNLSNPDETTSLPSSPKSITNQSLKHLDDISIGDDLSSQAIASGEEDDDSRGALSPGPDNKSQLIMPSIRMPSRRPFTERGKSMGRLKVLLAGAPGSGKTSLIKSIVQTCEDIVHVDPFPPPVPSSPRRLFRPQTRTTQAHGMPSAISEIFASTKPYPLWWSDLEDSRVLRRRKSLGDVVLERNVCFVDTPANSQSRAGQTDTVVQYMRQQLLRATNSLDSLNIDFENLLAGNGGSQVDTILYLISEDTLAADIECIRKLCGLTNVIPVISKADLLSPGQIATLKSSFHKQAQAACVKPFLFGDLSLSDVDGFDPRLPFAVSSAYSSDDDVMDASTLMSPDYVQPLAPSELGLLVEKMFDRDNMAWMRHSAAKKLAQRPPQKPEPQHSPRHSPRSLSQSSMSGLGSPLLSVCSSDGVISLPSGCPPSYTMARISDYTRNEERLAQVHLAKWAADLQLSLHNERQRYAAMATGDRAIWLTERLSECVVDGSLVPITKTPGFCGLHQAPSEKTSGGYLIRARNGQEVEYHLARLSPHDPLGVVWWTDDLRRRGWTVVQVVGSFGVMGGLAFWFAKAWGLPPRSLTEWPFNWNGHQ